MILVEILKFISTLFLFKTGLGILLDEVKKKGFLRYKNDILTLSKNLLFPKIWVKNLKFLCFYLT